MSHFLVDHRHHYHHHTLLLLILFHTTLATHYEPTWKSIDSRPLPQWYDDGKFGIFSHWGLYSVPSYGAEAAFFQEYIQGHYPDPDKMVEKFMRKNYRPNFTYADFGPQFTAELFNAKTFANIVKGSGAKYFVLTSKHVDGFTMWPSKYAWNWNAMDVGPKRDLVGELRNAFTELGGVHFGLYFCQLAWYNRLYIQDSKNKHKTRDYTKQITNPMMKEIVNNYKPDVFWSDGTWEADSNYWGSKEFLAWLYNDSPVKNTVITNTRWGTDATGNGTSPQHGGFWDRSDLFDPGLLKKHKWECCMMLDRKSWGFRRNMVAEDVLSVKDLTRKLARVISCNGNLLLNAGPTHDGRLVPIFEERLKQFGHWMKTNAEGVYGTKPWIYQNEGKDIWYTSKLRNGSIFAADVGRVFNSQHKYDTIIYAFVLEWPSDGTLYLPSVKPNAKTTASMLGSRSKLMVTKGSRTGAHIDLSPASMDWTKLPSRDAWVIKIEYADSEDRDPIAELIKEGKLNENGEPVEETKQAPSDYRKKLLTYGYGEVGSPLLPWK